MIKMDIQEYIFHLHKIFQFLTYRPLLVDLNGFKNDYTKVYLFIFDLDLALRSKYLFRLFFVEICHMMVK